MVRQLLALLFFVISLIYVIPCASEEKKLTIITEDWPPYNYNEHGAAKGFSVEIAKYIMKELKVNYSIRVLPSARIVNYIDNNPRTMFFTMIRTPERESQYKWIGPLDEGGIYFYKKKGNPLKIKTLDDAKNVRSVCCRHIGLVYRILVNSGFTNLDISSNPAGVYLKVVHDRCDLGIGGETSIGVKYWLKHEKLPVDALEKLPLKVVDMSLYIVCSKDVPSAEVVLWQKALDKMKITGDYNRLYQKYHK